MTSIAVKPFELERGERQLWSGAPRQGIVLRASDAFMIPFSFLWAGFAVFWEASVFRTPAPSFFVLWGIPFLVIGAYITIGRFFFDAWRRSRTTYAVTSERILIRSGGSLKSLSIRTLSDVTLAERSDGSGTITFGPTNFPMSMYNGTPMPGVPQPPALELIPNARQVFAQIRDAQRQSALPIVLP